MNPLHRRIMKESVLGDKEGLSLLTQRYYELEEYDRGAFLDECIEQGKVLRERLKALELRKLEEEEAQFAHAYDALEEEIKTVQREREEELRGAGAGGDDGEAGGRPEPDGQGDSALRDDASRAQ